MSLFFLVNLIADTNLLAISTSSGWEISEIKPVVSSFFGGNQKKNRDKVFLMRILLLSTLCMRTRIPLFWRTLVPNRWYNFFLSRLFFSQVLSVHRKIEGKLRFPTLPWCCTCLMFLHYQHPHQRGTFVTIEEPTLTHHHHPKSIVYILVHSWYCVFCCIWTNV